MPVKRKTLTANAAEMRKLIADLKSHLALGETDAEIAEWMELDADQLRILKREMYTREKLELNGKSTEEFYIDYRLRQEGVVAELDRMVEHYNPATIAVQGTDGKITQVDRLDGKPAYGGQPSAIVGALKAKSDIIDRIVKVGQEFGILEKAPEKKLIVGGIAIANMSTEELRKTIVGAVVSLKQISARYGDTDVLGNPLPNTLALPAPAPVAIQDAELVTPTQPKFSDKGKPKEAVGGRAKAAGANAVNRQKSVVPPAVKAV